MTPSEPMQRARGGCLTAFLALMLVANPLAGLYYLFAGPTVRQALPTLPGWVIPVLGLGALANTAFAVAIWKWKRWGVYGFAGCALLAFLINVSTVGVLPALLGLAGVVILILLVRLVWEQME